MRLRATGLVAWSLMLAILAYGAPGIVQTLQARKTASLLLRGNLTAAQQRWRPQTLEGRLGDAVISIHSDKVTTFPRIADLDPGTNHWWSAISAWEYGQDQLAIHQFLLSANSNLPSPWARAGGLRLSPDRRQVARNISADRAKIAELIPQSLETATRLTPVERRAIIGAAGTLHYQEGNWARAAELLSLAVRHETHSPTVQARLISALALDGQYGEARRQADLLPNPDAALQRAIQESNAWESAAATSSLSPVYDLNLRRRSAAVARAVDWMQTQQFLDDPALDRLPRMVPQLLGQDPIRLWFAAERQEAVGLSREAFSMYEKLHQLRPTLAGSVRMAQIGSLAPRLQPLDPLPFLGPGVESVSTIYGDQLSQIGGKPLQGEPTVLVEQPLVTTITLTSLETCELIVIGAGQRAANAAPVLKVSLQGQPQGYLCFPSDFFDAQRLTLRLQPGNNTISLELINKATSADQRGRLRSLRISHIMITKQASPEEQSN